MTFISPQFARFSVTGLGTTLLHVALAVSMIDLLAFEPVAANGAAFWIATVFAYICNTRWSFQARMNRQSVLHYTLTTAASFIFTILFSTLVQWMSWHYGVGIAMTVLALPILNYLAHRYFTYAEYF